MAVLNGSVGQGGAKEKNKTYMDATLKTSVNLGFLGSGRCSKGE